jgi:hypothetical protein
MLNTLKGMLAHQFDAAFCTLNACIDRCPETGWNSPVGNLAFCQVAFHTLFFADLYLGQNLESFRRQQFHRDNEDFSRDYEELQDRKQVLLYDRRSIKTYLEHCRTKASAVIAVEAADTLSARTGFERRDFSRAELHVYNIRHIQHHAAQLSLRLRLDAKQDIPWFGSGWVGSE